MRRTALVALFFAGLASGAGAETLRLDLTEPDHLPAAQPPPADPEILPPHPVMVRPRIVYAFSGALGAFAVSDATLSRLCRRGAFVQKTDRFFWARTPQKSYGVAFPTGGSLADLSDKKRLDMVYFFEDQDSDCRVYAGYMAKLMPYYKP
jgi:hypothetical protein